MSSIGLTRLALLATLAMSGCGSSPEPIFFTMSPTRGETRTSWARVVEIRKPALAGYLDRSEIVRRVVAFRLRVASGESWSEPLAEMVGRVLGDDLATRLPGSTVFGEAGPISLDPDAVVSLDVQRFDVDEGGSVTLVAQFTIERPPSHSAIRGRRTELQAKLAGADTAALVGAMSNLMGRLADVIAKDLEADGAAVPKP